jgi:hypothetical protein
MAAARTKSRDERVAPNDSERADAALEVLVCVHCAGKLRLVEIATAPAAIKRNIRDERRRRGEPVSEMEARAPPRGPPGQLMFAFR